MSLIEYNGESKVIKRICELLDTISGINFEVVQTLPLVDISTSTIYLVPKQTAQTDNVYDEYINTDGTSQGWELIGTTEIDLSNYYTKTQTDGLIQALDGVVSGSPSASKTLTAFSETDGKVSATFGDININQGQISNTCIVGTNSAISSGVTWHKVASATITTINTDTAILLAVNDTFRDENEDSNAGVLYCEVRQSDLGTVAYARMKLVANSGWETDKFRLYITSNSGTGITIEIWTSVTRRYQFRRFILINQGGRTTTYSNDWTLYDSTSPSNAPTESTTCVKYVCEDIKVDWVSNGKLGAKNLNSYPYYETNHTESDVNWTDSGDGTVTANGQAGSSANSNFICHSRATNYANPLILPNGTYILSGCPSGGSTSTYRLEAGITKNGSYSVLGYDIGSGVIITVDGDDNFNDKAYIQLSCVIYRGYNAQNKKFYPMIRLATDSDSTWQPYSMTNIELTDNVDDLNTNTPLNLDKAETNTWNLIRQPYWHTSGSSSGTTRTINADGSITITGTATASYYFNIKRYEQNWTLPKGRYKITGCPKGGSDSSYRLRVQAYINNSLVSVTSDYGDGAEFVLSDTTIMHITADVISGYAISGSLVFRPYIIPYEQVNWKANSILGAKNLNAYPPYNETSHTDTGVVFTDNGDGTIKATGKSTSASRSGFVCHSRSVGSVGSFFLKNGTYILTGCPSGGSETSYYIEVGRTVGSSLSRYGRETGNGLVFTVDGDANNTDKAQIQLVCYCYSNYQLPNDGIVFKPMIRLVEDSDNEWQPYTMTNKQLTDMANSVPTTTGTYALQATRNSDGTITYAWV